MMKKMICFDLDGTLWDTTDATYEAVNYYLKENGYSFSVSRDVIASNMGNDTLECAKNYFPQLDENSAVDLLLKAFDAQNQLILEKDCDLNVYDSVYDTLEELSKEYIICIVSNCSSNLYIENFIRTANVSSFITDYIPASLYSISKSESILKLKEKYHCIDVLYVGDTLKDMIATKEVGCPFIYARYGFGKNITSSFSISQFHELLDVVPFAFSK